MNINLTPEQERIVNDELKAGHFRTAQEVIGKAVEDVEAIRPISLICEEPLERQGRVQNQVTHRRWPS